MLRRNRRTHGLRGIACRTLVSMRDTLDGDSIRRACERASYVPLRPSQGHMCAESVLPFWP